MGGASSLLDEQGSPSRRWADLGVVRASELRGRRRAPAPAAPESAPVPERVEEPVAEPPRVDREGSAVLPVAAPLAGLLPDGGLRRGSTVAVSGSTSLLLAVLAEASRAGSWCAVVGLPDLGVQAAAEAGLDLARTALVPRPGPRPAAVVAALVDGVDVVVLDTALPGVRWPAGDRQRLGARVRQRGAVLVPVGAPGTWPGAEVELRAQGSAWAGLGGDGAGRLRSRRVRVRSAARGRPGEREEPLLLPGPAGTCLPDGELPVGAPLTGPPRPVEPAGPTEPVAASLGVVAG
ncbi:hypothetical protein EV188_11227 [Actinomycetospora succinea]|uniref:Protein RecA n=1 Tax=Actinomycetospora succinea TaxID=663603 RepID=A0A4V3D7G5_9PSEU|nr:hypothetical protein [Actinomycetospora succinea]TDQ47757.1 hypothetical protein EV188_11227 [Actinomycetospora succinea]